MHEVNACVCEEIGREIKEKKGGGKCPGLTFLVMFSNTYYYYILVYV